MKYIHIFLWLVALTFAYVIVDKALGYDIKFVCGSIYGWLISYYLKKK